MATVPAVIISFLIIVVLGLLVWLININSANRRDSFAQGACLGMLQQQLEALKATQDKTGENLNKSLISGQTSISQNVQASQKVLGELNNQIGQLHSANKQMLKVGDDIRRIQNIFSNPKMRGQMGEWSLNNLLENILPKDAYELQYSFKDGKTVDALIKLNGYCVPVDAKFPLPAFERTINAETAEQRSIERKQFLNDLIKHIDKISASYIRPVDGTLDFALMYLPAENVYYESTIKYDGDTKDILRYSFDKKVIPVSPNLLYAYLMTIVMGLQGMQIEKQASDIRQNLKKLNASFANFCSSWEVLGKHLRNAGTQYDEGDRKINKFGDNLEQIQENHMPEKDLIKGQADDL